MPAFDDLADRTFGLLTVERFDADRSTVKTKYWHCRCRCGRACSVSAGRLRDAGHEPNCGCLPRRNAKKPRVRLCPTCGGEIPPGRQYCREECRPSAYRPTRQPKAPKPAPEPNPGLARAAERKAEVRRLFAEGVRPVEIARRVGLSRQRVHVILHEGD